MKPQLSKAHSLYWQTSVSEAQTLRKLMPKERQSTALPGGVQLSPHRNLHFPQLLSSVTRSLTASATTAGGQRSFSP